MCARARNNIIPTAVLCILQLNIVRNSDKSFFSFFSNYNLEDIFVSVAISKKELYAGGRCILLPSRQLGRKPSSTFFLFSALRSEEVKKNRASQLSKAS